MIKQERLRKLDHAKEKLFLVPSQANVNEFARLINEIAIQDFKEIASEFTDKGIFFVFSNRLEFWIQKKNKKEATEIMIRIHTGSLGMDPGNRPFILTCKEDFDGLNTDYLGWMKVDLFSQIEPSSYIGPDKSILN